MILPEVDQKEATRARLQKLDISFLSERIGIRLRTVEHW